MYLLLNIVSFVLALLLCYFLGKLMRPNKNVGAKAIGFFGLLFIGPLIYSLTFIVLSATFIGGNEKIEQAFLNLLFLGMFLSPFVISFGVYQERK